MITFIDEHRRYTGSSRSAASCRLPLQFTNAHVAQRANPDKRSARSKKDMHLKTEISRVIAENFGVYGVRKVWSQLKGESVDVARCTVARLMQNLGLQGVVRANRSARPSATRRRHIRAITLTGSSMRQGRIGFRSAALPMSPPGQALSMWRS